ncbi:cytochrome b/b6 domain-containing protein [Pseudoroseomonas cervicalis]|uniref:cytochrome b/b6 domain-containing protein n=1 Tax=Teichococcus cervicalis TaxID=204525 RepID=UPI0022F14601|nr:cytochrome b/b6 domain-containing protein [Pseudoroseomonas cervicalis]WBV44071.1 cytochrome b/b6 domain-containing protein [Pseudoroseomonas cervicalis]
MPEPAPIRVKVWDGWVRLVHWALIGLIGLSWWSAETGRMDLHMTSGYAILTLLLFRLGWGVVGSDTARFGRFLRSPLAALGHLRHLFRREPDREIGHNAAGGWMVLALIAALLTQAVTGLFADDQIFTRGPLARSVPPEASDWATSIHIRAFNLILALAALHVLAVGLYFLAKGQNLVRPMLTGWKWLPAGSAAPRLAPFWLGLLLLALAALPALLFRTGLVGG